MDSLVQQAMAKWPSVPDCYGWLGLDARGRWHLRDAAVQAQGGFSQSRQEECKGSVLDHRGLTEFIGRNYGVDGHGCWYFQNGPQRVFVELECTPWVWRINQNLELHSHTGYAAQLNDCLVDEAGKLYLRTNIGFGLVHTQDIYTAAEAIESGQWNPRSVSSGELEARYGYVQSPQKRQKSHLSQAIKS